MPEIGRLTRRDMLKLGAGGAGMVAVGAGGMVIPRGFAGGGSLYIEAFPTSPLILNPFTDELRPPAALSAADMSTWGRAGSTSLGGYPDRDVQDGAPPCDGTAYQNRYHVTLGRHQL